MSGWAGRTHCGKPPRSTAAFLSVAFLQKEMQLKAALHDVCDKPWAGDARTAHVFEKDTAIFGKIVTIVDGPLTDEFAFPGVFVVDIHPPDTSILPLILSRWTPVSKKQYIKIRVN